MIQYRQNYNSKIYFADERVPAVVSSPRKSVLKIDIVEAEKKGKSVPFKKTFFG